MACRGGCRRPWIRRPFAPRDEKAKDFAFSLSPSRLPVWALRPYPYSDRIFGVGETVESPRGQGVVTGYREQGAEIRYHVTDADDGHSMGFFLAQELRALQVADGPETGMRG